jgi:protein involved in polysaccharide export with SLBB domain
MFAIVGKIYIRFCVLLCLGGSVIACHGDPTPIVDDPDRQTLSLSATDGRVRRDESGADYRLGPNDRLRVTVFGQPTLTGEYMLDGNSVLAFPLIGNVDARGMTTQDLQRAIAGKLHPEYLANPSISIEVTNRRPFYVLGEVQKPGNYPYVTDMTALNAVAMAGGYTYRARKTQFYIKRLDGNGRMVRVVARPETILRPGDTLEVNERSF